MLALNLLPGTGLGCFSLGCSINQALINIRQAQTTFGCVELKYFEKTTSLDDILLNLPEHGVHLIFESSSQTLRLIEVYDLSRLQVKRGAATVGGSAHPPTFQALYDLMGPTYPGQVDTAHGCYVMHWPGLLVLFPIASQHAASWQDMQQGRALPLALPDGTAPVASRLCIHAGNAAVSLGDLVQAISPANFESPPSVGIRVGKGLTMDDTHQQLSFGDSPQDAWSTLGAPNATFSKQTPGLPQQGSANIRGAQQQVPASPADYFYNYFDRGLDVLFCGTTHRIKKMEAQDWMLQAEGAHKSASSPDYSPAAPAAVQQALLDDIKAMTRADSDAGSSDSSMTQEGAPFSAGTVPQTGEEEQQAQQLPEVEARAELAGSGESAPVDFGDEGGSAGDVGSEGWDDADPMAMLSQSVQSLARAQQAESELRQDASSWTAQEVPSGIMPEHPEAASETVLVSAGESAELQSRGSRSGSYDGNDANSSAQAGNGLAGGLESACLEHDASASVLTADSTWAEVENVLGKGNRAVIHTRGVGGGPYGPTMVHGYPGIVFEVTQAGQVASVTLFDF
ncbi:hypothetical protein WJX79_000798 [Trebouxia sp. C0005]